MLNAGLATPAYSAGPGGWEIASQVNVLSTALLAILLLPKLHDTASRTKTTPHLSFVNSVAHQEVTPDWLHADKSLIQQINDPTAFDDRRQYALVKLASSYVMPGLLETLRPKDVIIINAACPGLCRTDLGRDWPCTAGCPSCSSRPSSRAPRSRAAGPWSARPPWALKVMASCGPMIPMRREYSGPGPYIPLTDDCIAS